MQSKFISVLRWAGACMMLLLILQLIIEGTWALGWYRSWPFVLTVLCCTILLAAAGIMDWRQRAWMRALNHLGLFCVLLGGMLGAVVEEDVKIVVDSHASERVAYTDQGEARVLPFSLKLADFRIDYYEDGQHPKQYTSSLLLDDNQLISTSVNHPAIVDGWWIYQSDYDRQQSDFVILQLVRDPWLPLVYLGFVLMVLGALWMTIRAWHSWKVLPATLVLACLFGAASLARIELGTLVPALRSLWFFPHILIYMIAYSLLAITLLFALYRLLHKESMVSEQMVERLFATVSALLLVGMLCGAFWAKEAWGHYWTWDAKECWAAVTWLISVMAIHMPQRLANGSNRKAWLTSIFILLTFAAMQVTWYGVNYLPSAAYSLHTYTK